jgi:hypothetical protein
LLLISSLILIDESGGLKKLLVAASLLILAGLSSELGAAIAIIVSLYTLLFQVRRLSGRGRILATTTYVAIGVFSYALISWYLGETFLKNLVLGSVSSVSEEFIGYHLANGSSGNSAPLVILGNLEERPGVYPYILIGFGPLIPLYLLGVEKFWGRAKVSIATVSTLVAISLTPLMMPWTDLSRNEWDRLLMSACQVIIAVSLTQLNLMKSRTAKALFLFFIILPGFFAVGPEDLNFLNINLTKSLNRYPLGMIPYPSVFYDNALEIARKASEAGRPIIVDRLIERFVHLHVRNPRPGDILVASPPTPYYIACAILSLNTNRTYLITDTNWTNPLQVEVSTSGGKLLVQLEIKKLYSSGPYMLLEISLKEVIKEELRGGV